MGYISIATCVDTLLFLLTHVASPLS